MTIQVLKGKEGIVYDLDLDFAYVIAEANQTCLRFENVKFPYLKIKRWVDEKDSVCWQQAERAVLAHFKIETTRRDFITNKDGDFSNLTLNNLVVIKVGTEAHRRIYGIYKDESFEPNPYPGVFWHLWTNKWAAYDRHKAFIGLFATAREADAAIHRFENWWSSPV